MSKTAAQNKTIALAVRSEVPPPPSELETIVGYIDREAEAGGLQVSTASLSASTISALTALGYVVVHVTQDTAGAMLDPSFYTISWDV
jgi:hypothetical protein